MAGRVAALALFRRKANSSPWKIVWPDGLPCEVKAVPSYEKALEAPAASAIPVGGWKVNWLVSVNGTYRSGRHARRSLPR